MYFPLIDTSRSMAQPYTDADTDIAIEFLQLPKNRLCYKRYTMKK